MKPSQFFLDIVALYQQLSVQAEIEGDKKMQAMADLSAPMALRYAAFFKMVGL